MIAGKVDAPLTALGPQMVKNIPSPVEAWRVEIDGVHAPAPAPRVAERPSIAVLPFENMSSDPDQDFLADGIVEDIITELSRFRSLFVIARNSTFVYRGTHKDVRVVARELGVRYIVEGAVRRSGDRLRKSELGSFPISSCDLSPKRRTVLSRPCACVQNCAHCGASSVESSRRK